jgi:hypothetical protein
MTDAVMFSPEGKNVLPAKILYKKNILALRGSFRPVTKVNVEMYLNSIKLFLKQKNVELEKTQVVFEITLSNLKSDGEIDEQDFLDRAKLLCSLGQTVLISDFKEYYKLVEYFSLYTKKKIGITMGINNLIEIFNPKYYTQLSGGILEAFGKLFFKNVKVFAYPMLDENGQIVNSDNLKVHPRMKELYKFFKYNGKVEDVVDYDINHLKIFSREVLKLINSGDPKWEDMLPKGVSKLIKEQKLFGYK